MSEKRKREICSPQTFGHRPIYIRGEAAADLAFPTRERRCVEKSGILVSQPSPLGKGDRVAVDRVLSYNGALETISFALFHTARTLSGSFCSPPSPRGEGFARGIVFPHMHVFTLTIWG